MTAQSISPDEIAYLASMAEQERTALAALQATRTSYESHLAKKYSLSQGDQISADGTIIRKAPAAQDSEA